jgi:hypothetical protein
MVKVAVIRQYRERASSRSSIPRITLKSSREIREWKAAARPLFSSFMKTG